MAISSGIANANITVINVILNTNGGEAYDAFKFYHNFKKLKHNIEINIYAENKVYSAGIFIYLAFSSRYCLNNSDFMIHAVKKRGATSLDRKAIALNILRHRLIKSYRAEAEGVKIESIIAGIL
jgi:ATP-dependent protease ClpP protease subunit